MYIWNNCNQCRACGAVLTWCGQNDFDKSFVNDLGGSVYQMQNITAAVIVPEQQQTFGQLAQAVVGNLCEKKMLIKFVRDWIYNQIYAINISLLCKFSKFTKMYDNVWMCTAAAAARVVFYFVKKSQVQMWINLLEYSHSCVYDRTGIDMWWIILSIFIFFYFK